MRERIKRLPWIGPAGQGVYLRLRYGDGRVETIRGGRLRGWKFVRFVRTVNEEFIRGDYEAELQGAMAAVLKPGGTFFDVGANAGFLTLLGSALVGASGKVVAFEPHPVTARQLRRQLRANDVRNVRLVEAAASNRAGRAEFADDTFSVCLSLAEVADRRPAYSISVETRTLDDAAAEFGVPDVVKIDVEGAEVLALEGASELLRTRGPTILLELHSAELNVRCREILAAAGYSFWLLDGRAAPAGEEQRFLVCGRGAASPLAGLAR